MRFTDTYRKVNINHAIPSNSGVCVCVCSRMQVMGVGVAKIIQFSLTTVKIQAFLFKFLPSHSNITIMPIKGLISELALIIWN